MPVPAPGPSATVENYLKQIYLLEQRRGGDVVPMGAIADAMAVVPGTATVMIQRSGGSDGIAIPDHRQAATRRRP